MPQLNENELKIWLQKKLERIDKLLLIVAVVNEPCSISEIKKQAYEVGFRVPRNWNVSSLLSRSDGKAIRTPRGWELSAKGKVHLHGIGVSSMSSAVNQVAVDLRKLLQNLNDEQTKSFIEEAINCHEAGLYRAAIILSWLGAVDVLHKYVHLNYLKEFNQEAFRVMGAKWKDAKSTDDIGKMKEVDFLDRIASLSIIGKNVKTDLKICLDRRNGCGHPNTFLVSTNQSAAHLETLLLNVFQKFS